NFSLATIGHEEAARYYGEMTRESATKVAANLVNRDLCRRAREMLSGPAVDPAQLGRMLTEHHEQLSRGIQVSTPLSDEMLQAALDAGAR
ncbi:MAG: GHMP kinase, partial [Armatimonadota bacterium]